MNIQNVFYCFQCFTNKTFPLFTASFVSIKQKIASGLFDEKEIFSLNMIEIFTSIDYQICKSNLIFLCFSVKQVAKNKLKEKAFFLRENIFLRQ